MTTSGSIYDRWMKNCYKDTKVLVTDSFTNALIAFRDGRADALMWDDTVLLGIAVTDRNYKLTERPLPPAALRHRDQAGQHRAQGVGRLAPEPHEEAGPVLPDPQEHGAARPGRAVLEEHPAPEADVRLHPGRSNDAVLVAALHDLIDGAAAPARPLRRPFCMTSLAVAFDWSFVSENGDELLAGLRRTLEVSAIAIAGAFVIGLVLGAARAHRVPVISQLAAIYVEIIRNTPILVQIFFLFFALPQIGIVLEPFTVAWLAVTIWGGAFNTENFRAGFEAVPFRFREAGSALGFGPLATFLNVTLPIGGRIALPSSINTYISVVKNTSLMYVISYPELTTTALNINALTLQTVETFTTLAVSLPRDRVDDVGVDPRRRAPSRPP